VGRASSIRLEALHIQRSVNHITLRSLNDFDASRGHRIA
jgi:hypothetical protein